MCIAPCFCYLVLVIADAGVQLGLLRNRALKLAEHLEEDMRKVTPPELA